VRLVVVPRAPAGDPHETDAPSRGALPSRVHGGAGGMFPACGVPQRSKRYCRRSHVLPSVLRSPKNIRFAGRMRVSPRRGQAAAAACLHCPLHPVAACCRTRHPRWQSLPHDAWHTVTATRPDPTSGARCLCAVSGGQQRLHAPVVRGRRTRHTTSAQKGTRRVLAFGAPRSRAARS
jgi:hypothetical protein